MPTTFEVTGNFAQRRTANSSMGKAIHEGLRFIGGGAINFLLSYCLYLGLLQMLAPSLAYTAAYVLGIVVSYFINAFFVFRATVSARALLRFPLIYFGQYLLGLAIVTSLCNYFLVGAAIAGLVAAGAGAVFSYIMMRQLVFR